jgi:hypothetical protein
MQKEFYQSNKIEAVLASVPETGAVSRTRG